MRVFIKDRGAGKAEAWVEDYIPGATDFEVVSIAKLIIVPGNKCLIDTIDTPPKYRQKGYATAIIKELQKHFKEVAPIGVIATSQGFWDKFGMVDALGEERDG